MRKRIDIGLQRDLIESLKTYQKLHEELTKKTPKAQVDVIEFAKIYLRKYLRDPSEAMARAIKTLSVIDNALGMDASNDTENLFSIFSKKLDAIKDNRGALRSSVLYVTGRAETYTIDEIMDALREVFESSTYHENVMKILEQLRSDKLSDAHVTKHWKRAEIENEINDLYSFFEKENPIKKDKPSHVKHTSYGTGYTKSMLLAVSMFSLMRVSAASKLEDNIPNTSDSGEMLQLLSNATKLSSPLLFSTLANLTIETTEFWSNIYEENYTSTTTSTTTTLNPIFKDLENGDISTVKYIINSQKDISQIYDLQGRNILHFLASKTLTDLNYYYTYRDLISYLRNQRGEKLNQFKKMLTQKWGKNGHEAKTSEEMLGRTVFPDISKMTLAKKKEALTEQLKSYIQENIVVDDEGYLTKLLDVVDEGVDNLALFPEMLTITLLEVRRIRSQSISLVFDPSFRGYLPHGIAGQHIDLEVAGGMFSNIISGKYDAHETLRVIIHEIIHGIKDWVPPTEQEWKKIHPYKNIHYGATTQNEMNSYSIDQVFRYGKQFSDRNPGYMNAVSPVIHRQAEKMLELDFAPQLEITRMPNITNLFNKMHRGEDANFSTLTIKESDTTLEKLEKLNAQTVITYYFKMFYEFFHSTKRVGYVHDFISNIAGDAVKKISLYKDIIFSTSYYDKDFMEEMSEIFKSLNTEDQTKVLFNSHYPKTGLEELVKYLRSDDYRKSTFAANIILMMIDKGVDMFQQDQKGENLFHKLARSFQCHEDFPYIDDKITGRKTELEKVCPSIGKLTKICDENKDKLHEPNKKGHTPVDLLRECRISLADLAIFTGGPAAFILACFSCIALCNCGSCKKCRTTPPNSVAESQPTLDSWTSVIGAVQSEVPSRQL